MPKIVLNALRTQIFQKNWYLWNMTVPWISFSEINTMEHYNCRRFVPFMDKARKIVVLSAVIPRRGNYFYVVGDRSISASARIRRTLIKAICFPLLRGYSARIKGIFLQRLIIIPRFQLVPRSLKATREVHFLINYFSYDVSCNIKFIKQLCYLFVMPWLQYAYVILPWEIEIANWRGAL